MISLVAFILLTIAVYTSLKIFNKIFNPLSIYSFIWFFLLFFYELKLIRYPELSSHTLLVVLAGFVSFYLGILFYYLSNFNYVQLIRNNFSAAPKPTLFYKKGYYIKLLIVITGLIGLAGAIQHWMVLLGEYGSLTDIILSANVIYRERVQGDLEGVIPYISTFSFVSLFFASVYSAHRGKISILILIPAIGIILKDLALVGRTSMLMMMMIFFSVYIFYKSIYGLRNASNKRFNKKTLFGITIVIALLLVSASLVKVYRAGLEDYKASTRELRQFEEDLIFSPSVYLYMSSHVGVLDKYFRKSDEEVNFGENTFMSFYRILHKFELVKEPQFYQKGYYIPMWTNTGTYLREIHADFGYAGIFLFPFLLGFLLVKLWYSLLKRYSFPKFLFLIYLNLIVFYSFLLNVTRLGNWLISLIITLFLIVVTQKYIVWKSNVLQEIN